MLIYVMDLDSADSSEICTSYLLLGYLILPTTKIYYKIKTFVNTFTLIFLIPILVKVIGLK